MAGSNVASSDAKVQEQASFDVESVTKSFKEFAGKVESQVSPQLVDSLCWAVASDIFDTSAGPDAFRKFVQKVVDQVTQQLSETLCLEHQRQVEEVFGEVLRLRAELSRLADLMQGSLRRENHLQVLLEEFYEAPADVALAVTKRAKEATATPPICEASTSFSETQSSAKQEQLQEAWSAPEDQSQTTIAELAGIAEMFGTPIPASWQPGVALAAARSPIAGLRPEEASRAATVLSRDLSGSVLEVSGSNLTNFCSPAAASRSPAQPLRMAHALLEAESKLQQAHSAVKSSPTLLQSSSSSWVPPSPRGSWVPPSPQFTQALHASCSKHTPVSPRLPQPVPAGSIWQSFSSPGVTSLPSGNPRVMQLAESVKPGTPGSIGTPPTVRLGGASTPPPGSPRLFSAPPLQRIHAATHPTGSSRHPLSPGSFSSAQATAHPSLGRDVLADTQLLSPPLTPRATAAACVAGQISIAADGKPQILRGWGTSSGSASAVAVSAQASASTMASAGDEWLMAAMIGKWHYPGSYYEVLACAGKLFFEQHVPGEGVMRGQLLVDGEWLTASVAKPSGEVCGEMRLRHRAGKVISNYKALGSDSWSGDITATNEASQRIPIDSPWQVG